MYTTILRYGIASLALAAFLATGSAGVAQTVSYKANLSGQSEFPATDSKGTGAMNATYDKSSKKLTWTVTYSGLSGNPTLAHFHGPVSFVGMTSDKNAPVTLPIKSSLASPINGSAILTDKQAKDFLDGLWYFNIHTAAHAGGEIRGQVLRAN
jgi:hypothetical protein